MLTFRHPLVRSAVLQSAGAETRRSAHRALAAALADHPDRHAWHRAAAAPGPDEAVARIVEEAADRALEHGAPSSAETWFEKAAELSEHDGTRGRRLLRAAEVAFQIGNPADVHRFMARARPLQLDPTERGLFAFLEGAFDDGTPGDAQGVQRLVDSAARARDDGEPEVAANLLVGAAIRCWWGDPGQPIRDGLLAVADSLPLPQDDPRLLAGWAVGGGLERHRHVVAALARWSERSGGDADPDAGPGSAPDLDPAAGALLARAAFVCGEFERTLTFSRPAADGLRRQGRLGVLANVLVLRTFAALYLGRWDLMETAADEALRLSSETRQPVWEACSGLAKANLAGLRGAARLSAELLAVPERVAVSTGNESVMNGAQLSKGLRELGRENPAEAFWQLRRMLDPRDHAYHAVQQLWAVDYLAEAAVGAGEVDRARELVTALEPALALAPGIGNQRAMRFAQALLAEDAEAEAAYEAAHELAWTAPPWYRARLDLAYGAWLRRKRKGTGARIPLQAAHAVFESLGAVAWAERAARELRAAGVKDQVTVISELTSLSPQELQIARLAAKGLSNRDIGQQLYLSHRTVGSHLYRIFPKLGITSRSQLHALLPPSEQGE
ncbi:LuxR C-terminal-related transcriptional regulator [Catenulispora yoronensis]